MMDLAEFRKVLGPAGENMPDAEVLRIRQIEYGLADAIFEQWLRKRNKARRGKKVDMSVRRERGT